MLTSLLENRTHALGYVSVCSNFLKVLSLCLLGQLLHYLQVFLCFSTNLHPFPDPSYASDLLFYSLWNEIPLDNIYILFIVWIYICCLLLVPQLFPECSLSKSRNLVCLVYFSDSFVDRYVFIAILLFVIKQTRRPEMESWIQKVFWWLPDGREVWGVGWRGEGIKKYK